MLSIGSCKLGIIPRAVAIVDRPLTRAAIQKCVAAGVDMLEIRVDCFPDSFEAITAYIQKVKQWVSLPLIGTIRENEKNRGLRLEQFKKIVPLVDCLDIEIEAPIRDQVVALAPKSCTIMISAHDFKKTPDLKRLNQIVSVAIKSGAQIVKIATTAQSATDVVRLLQFTEKSKKPLVTIAMGEIGTISRLIAPLFGSLFTYGYITAPVAPGQISTFNLVEDLRRYFSEFDKKCSKIKK